MCGSTLKKNIRYEHVQVRGGDGFHTERREAGILGYGYASQGYFCTLTCGYTFAVISLKDAQTG